MEEGSAVITISLVESEGKRYTGMISYSGDFSCIPTTIKRRRTDALTPKNIFNKRGVNETDGRTWTYFDVNTEKIVVSMLEKMMFRPESKIMINRFPRAIGDMKTRPLRTRT
jgi:hypothetical protein